MLGLKHENVIYFFNQQHHCISVEYIYAVYNNNKVANTVK